VRCACACVTLQRGGRLIASAPSIRHTSADRQAVRLLLPSGSTIGTAKECMPFGKSLHACITV
jgi:hypothetical protein